LRCGRAKIPPLGMPWDLVTGKFTCHVPMFIGQLPMDGDAKFILVK